MSNIDLTSWGRSLVASLQELEEKKISSNTNLINYYVNSVVGNDENDGLTIETPFKTIQHAIDILPKCLKYSAIIHLAEGEYPEDVRIENFFGGSTLAIRGNIVGDDSSALLEGAEAYKVNSIVINACKTGITLSGINVIGQNETYTSAISVLSSPIVQIWRCRTENASNFGIYANYSSHIYAANCLISNKISSAFYALFGAIIEAHDPTGTLNKRVLYVYRGGVIRTTVATTKIQNMGETAFQVAEGGVITNISGQSV